MIPTRTTSDPIAAGGWTPVRGHASVVGGLRRGAIVVTTIVGLAVLALSLLVPPAHASSAGASEAGSPAGPSETEGSPAGPSDTGPAERLVIIGASGLSMADITEQTTPTLHEFAGSAAAANISVRSLTSATCPASGWLTLGAGDRVGAVEIPTAEDDDEGGDSATDSTPPGPAGQSAVVPDADEPAAEGATAHPTNYVAVPPAPEAACPEYSLPTSEPETNGTDSSEPETGETDSTDPADPATSDADSTETGETDSDSADSALHIPGFDRIVSANASSGYGASFGTLADAPSCTQAIGPGAGYAAASPTGEVEDWHPAGAEIGDCPLTLVDVGALGAPSWLPETISDNPLIASDPSAQLRVLDRRIAGYLDQIDEETTDVVIVGLGDTSSPSRLRALLAAGPNYEPGLITSTSTRHEGLAQLTDVASATLSRVAGQSSPDGAMGATYSISDTESTGEERVETLVLDAERAATVHTHAQTFSVTLDVIHYLLFAVLGVGLLASLHRRLSPGRRRLIHTVLAWAGLALGTIPMGSFLAGIVPWQRIDPPGLGLALAIAAGSLVLFGIAFAGPWRRTWRGRVAAICLTSAAVLALDIAIGSHLQFNSLMGYNPIVAGRFYGLGNQGAAIFIVAVFLGLGLACAPLVRAGRRRRAALLIGIIGLASVATLGNPAWGAKFGGTIATLAGFLVLAALVLGIRLNLWRLALIGTVSLLAIVGVAGLDYLRPPASRSHFGTFFGQLLDGELFVVVGRKLAANLNIISINPALAIIVPLATLAILFFLSYLARFRRTAVLARPWVGRLPEALADSTVHAGFLAAAIGLAVGLVITDSGVAVPATGAMMLLPLLLALCAPGTEKETGPEKENAEAEAGAGAEADAGVGSRDT